MKNNRKPRPPIDTGRPVKFRLHFNRINMQRRRPTIWTVHTHNLCIPASHVHVNVPLDTEYKGPDAPQPRAFFTGRGIITQKGTEVYID